MKKLIIGFILGGIIFGSIGIYAASYVASDISYTREDSEVKNVNDALNSLYNMKEELNTLKSLGNADASQIAEGYTALVKGELVTGTAQPPVTVQSVTGSVSLSSNKNSAGVRTVSHNIGAGKTFAAIYITNVNGYTGDAAIYNPKTSLSNQSYNSETGVFTATITSSSAGTNTLSNTISYIVIYY